MTASSENPWGISVINYPLPLRGGMGWGFFYFFLHSIYPAPAIAKSKITIAM